MLARDSPVIVAECGDFCDVGEGFRLL